MITNRTDEADLEAKQEKQNADGGVYSRTLPSSSRQWPSFRNPRIVRVSRSFGGKDRHSKVCTVRGLRDRRIRLSVPTAVQLYDLQDKLGLSQPSKVIDWLLDATKQDIDKLPPLQMPQGFSQFHPHMFGDGTTGSRNAGNLLIPDESITSQFSLSPLFPMNRGIKINDSADGEGNEAARASSSKYNWDINLGLRAEDNELLHIEKGKSIEMNQLQKQVGIGSHYAQASAPNFSPIVSYYPSFPSGSANNAVPYSYSQWDPSNLSLSQLGGLQVQPQIENFLHSNSVSLPLPSSPPALQLGSQLYPGPLTMPSLFPSYPPYLAASTENDLRRINRSKFLHPQYHSQSQDDEQAK